MRIPVFVSTPTVLNRIQEKAKGIVYRELRRVGIEPRTLGRTDYPTELPLREVLVVGRHCAGAVVLGFEQFRANSGVSKRGTAKEAPIKKPVCFPTPWNHLEAGILTGLGLPLLVLKEPLISGGVFDYGVTDAYVHDMPSPTMSSDARAAFAGVIMKWQAKVREHYYQ
jgi:hypothetical protein